MILLIDNYDSFSYNLFQLVGSMTDDVKVIRNDAMTAEEIAGMGAGAIIISPGPGRPKDAGVCEEVIKKLGPEVPILGVCLGHQAICEAYGGAITYAKEVMHGKQSVININPMCPLFKGMEGRITVGRYHSLAAAKGALGPDLMITATADDGEIMAVRHKKYQVYGLQFHPESILTPDGGQIVQNFLEAIK
jgi:glutamine amidotransferase of anthranilate synthase or aminodeoxychorismate synthase